MAIDVDKNTLLSLEYIKQGYIQYGVEGLKKSATLNSLAAQFYVAVCYEHGIATEKNLADAFRMYRRAAERGLPDAMHHIASFYRNGMVVQLNVSKSDEWLNRFQQRGGQFLLPDFIKIYEMGIKHADNYSLDPTKSKNFAKPEIKQNVKEPIAHDNSIGTSPSLQNNNSYKPIGPVIKSPSDVDIKIPLNSQNMQNVFAIIIGNEKYKNEVDVPFANNDSKIFSQYVEKTLGIPHEHIRLIENAGFNDIRIAVNWLVQAMQVCRGKGKAIVYYAGHGIPNESDLSSYLLPVDGIGNDPGSAYSLKELYDKLGSVEAQSITVFLDACFSGSKREDGMLASARGVALRAKQSAPKGNMIVFTAAQGDETAYPYKDKQHGMFTYFLLKKLQETKGDVTLGELSEYLTDEVGRQSFIKNNKIQTPSVNVSTPLKDSWRTMTLK